MGATSLQAECIDEQCSFEEFLEAYQHLPLEQQRLKTTNDLTQEFKKYTSPCDFKGRDNENFGPIRNYRFIHFVENFFLGRMAQFSAS